jgi:hypothetical protein
MKAPRSAHHSRGSRVELAEINRRPESQQRRTSATVY